MTVGEIISLGALLSGKDDISADFAAGDANGNDAEIKKFFTAYNLTVSELSEEVEPLIKTETIVTDGGKILFTELSEKIKRIIDIKENGRTVAFKVFPQYALTSAAVAEVTYAYSPEYVSSGEEICPYDERTFSKRTLATAVAAEYLLTIGLFDEAVNLRKRFEDEISAYAIRKKRGKMKKRTWA